MKSGAASLVVLSVLVALYGGGPLVLCLVLSAHIALAFLTVKALAGAPIPSSKGLVYESVAWLLAVAALSGIAVLSSPYPRWLSSRGIGRSTALLVLGGVAVAAVTWVLRKQNLVEEKTKG